MALQGYFTRTTSHRCCRCLIAKHNASMHIRLNIFNSIHFNIRESSILGKTNSKLAKLALSPSKDLSQDDDFCVPCCFWISMK